MMNPKINSIFLILLTFIFVSCEKEEQPIAKKIKPGNQLTSAVFLDPDYKYQVFYDLETNTEVARNLTTAWDLGFECGNDGYHVKLNTSRGMQVWSSGSTLFSAVENTTGAKWNWDNPNGSIDSTAIGSWGAKNGNDVISSKQVFVLDLGYDSEGKSKGFRKMQIIGLEANEYSVKIADLSGENEFLKVIKKDNDYNFVFLSIDGNGKIMTIEPPKNDWDLVFTKYTHIFSSNNELIPYGVTGVLINSSATSVHQDTFFGFDDTDLEIAKEVEYIPDHHTIGYDWKTYDYSSGGYIINTEKNYLIKNRVGNFYKFHIIDFYNENGQKGNIVFEFQRL